MIITKEKQSMKNMVFFIFLAILPILYVDPIGLTPLISALSLTHLFYKKSDVAQREETLKKKNYTGFFLALIAGAVSYIIYYFIATGDWNNGIMINNEIIVLPTKAMLFIILTPIAWLYWQQKKAGEKLLKFDKEVIKLTFLICVIFFNFSLARISVYLRDYSDVTFNQSLHMIVQAFFVASIAEELFYRGLIYNLLKQSFNIRKAQIISAIIFTFSHFNLLFKGMEHFDIRIVFNYIAIFALGMTTAIIYEKKKSLLPCIFLHASINGGLKYIVILVMNLYWL